MTIRAFRRPVPANLTTRTFAIRPAILLISLGLTSVANAQNVAIDWAKTTTLPGTSNLLGAPDNLYSILTPQAATLGAFGGTTSYSLTGFASLLGVSPSVLGPNQIFGFDYNSFAPTPGGGWESSVWTFSDGSNTRFATFNELTGQLEPSNSSPDVQLVASGSIDQTAYRQFFGITPTLPGSVFGFVLIQIPTSIDTSNPAFTVSLASRTVPGEYGTPDVDSVGVIRAIPSPSSTSTALLGLGGLLGARRRR